MRSSMKHVAAGLLVGGLVLAPVGARAMVSDAWITAKAKIALMTTKDVSSTAINVDTFDGVVTLHGKVSSAEEKARAEAEAKKIEGVKEVRNLLQVVPERQQKIVKASDKEIKDRVEKALKQNPALKDSSIAVQSVNDGVVLLSGKANSVADHLAAVDAVSSVPGVRKVESEVQSPDRLADEEIRRQPSSPTAGAKRGIGQAAKDMWITSDVKMRLLADEKTPANDINVDTRNGVVTLFGAVPSQAAKAAAETEARKVSGVSRVINELEIVPKASKETVAARDDQLQDEIAKRLKSREDLKGASIDVDVKNAVARLTGTVDDDYPRLAAAVAARSVPGVRAVHQELRVNRPER
jgi:hyperosmotically inducible periplasmic protein